MTLTTVQDVLNLLPDPPQGGYSYEAVQVSPRVIRVDLVFPHLPYSNTKPHTPYAFVKGDVVYPPLNHKTARPESVCTLVDLYKQPPYTTFVPTIKSLLHLK